MKIKIEYFSLIHQPAVLSISREQVGKNFIDEKYLAKFLNNKNAKGIVAIANDKIIGFSFFQWCTPHELSQYIFTDSKWVNEIFKKNEIIGYRNLTAVEKKFQHKGAGSMLVDFSIKELSKRTDAIANVVWKTSNKKNLGKVLRKYGLKPVKIISGYWKKDSLRRKYECAVCGKPPCKCDAEIYFMGTDNR